MALLRGSSAFALLLCVALAGLATPAEAKKRAETFKGTCEMSGAITHDPPMTTTPKPTQVHGSFNGTGSGKLPDRKGWTKRLDGAKGSYEGLAAG